MALTFFEENDLTKKYLEQNDFYEAYNLKLKDSAPAWISRIIQRTETEVKNAHIHYDPSVPTVINGLKYFSGEKNTYFGYHEQSSLLILDEINKLKSPYLDGCYIDDGY